MAKAGIGVDIVEISRMASILQKTPSFAQRVFTDDERHYCESSSRAAAHYAGRFAAREAVLKALGTGFSHGVGRKDVSVGRDSQGRPFVIMHGKALEIAKDLGVVEVALSLTFTGDLAVANAMAITADSRPQAKPSVDNQKTRLARSFREARSVIDELDSVQYQELFDVTTIDSRQEGEAAHEAGSLH